MIKPWFSGKKKRNNEKLLRLKATATFSILYLSNFEP